MSFHGFGQCSQLFIDTALQKPKSMLKSYHWASYKWKQNWKTPTGSFFIAAFVWAGSRKITHSFWATQHSFWATQDYELKCSIQMNFDTLISNLKSYFQYEIVMTLLWRNIWQISKTTSFFSQHPLIYRTSAPNNSIFSRYFTCSTLFPDLCQAKYLKDNWKRDFICQKN